MAAHRPTWRRGLTPSCRRGGQGFVLLHQNAGHYHQRTLILSLGRVSRTAQLHSKSAGERARGRLLSDLSPDEAALLFGALLRAFTTKIVRAVVVRWSLGVWLANSTNPVGDNFFWNSAKKLFDVHLGLALGQGTEEAEHRAALPCTRLRLRRN
jgi:hypothetical protein